MVSPRRWLPEGIERAARQMNSAAIGLPRRLRPRFSPGTTSATARPRALEYAEDLSQFLFLRQ
jgi:hypothetical protein